MKRDRTGKPTTAIKAKRAAAISPALVLLVLLSGFAALMYQILWMRQLGLVFGNTAHAAAMTLAIFFAGLAAGGWLWGRLSARMAAPLRTYAWLELGIGVAGILCLPLLAFYRDVYPTLHGRFDGAGLWTIKALLALVMVFPASFLMGGTLPVMGRQLVARREAFGRITAAMYGINTLGAAGGAFAAAFVLLPALGFRQTCFLAVAISTVVALLAWWLARQPGRVTAAELAESDADGRASEAPPLSRPVIRLLALVSGFNVLALEVLWTRMFAQVHENSVYSFAAVLIVVLLSLAAGAWLASWLAGRAKGPMPTLVVLVAACALAVWVVPFSFMKLTGELSMLPERGSFGAYVTHLFATAFGAIGPSCLVLGSLFPFLMKGEERFANQPGRSIGMLTALNTVGAIFGSLVCGFLLLNVLGLWRTMQVLATLYLLIALLLPVRGHALAVWAKVAAVVLMLIAFGTLKPDQLPVTGLDPAQGRQEVVERWEASDGTVTVVRKANGEHAIRINSNYSLGSSEAYMSQIYQTRVPLLAFPDTKSIFFLGLGTGITAGEALDRRDFGQVEKVVVCELSPSVVAAAKKYFGGSPGRPDLVNGLFKDPRAEVLIEDGRNHLMANEQRYDMINADLFLPYRRGSGSLYTVEHFETVRERLNPGGVFVQWLPLYQLSEKEFGVIARTMLEVFDRVTLWRSHFKPGAATVAMVGHRDDDPLPPCSLDTTEAQRRAVMGVGYQDMGRMQLPVNEQTILLFYCGNLSGSRQRFADYPLNTDDQPVIEYGTPRSLHRVRDGQRPQFMGEKLAAMVDSLLEATPPASDPVLVARSPQARKLPLAGAVFHRAWLAMAGYDSQSLRKYWEAFRGIWLDAATAP